MAARGPNPRLEAEVGAHHAAGRLKEACELLVRGYGPEIYGFLLVTLSERADADEAFSMFAEGVWASLAGFRAQSTFRTWAYAVARNAAWKLRRGQRRRSRREIRTESAAERVAAQVRSSTAAFQRTDVKDRVRALRAQLTPEEQELLVLRIDRGLDWLDVARIVADEPDADDRALGRRGAALRKKFERTKERLQTLAEQAGVLR